ncbi:MAG: CotH kinase family protein, partial [Verrucomicrobiales bacterium]
ATIRYTTNGEKPTATTGTVYTGPITVNGTTTLRAAAFKTGFDPTDVDTHTYLFADDIITQSSSAPPGWPAGSVNGQVYEYGMNSSIVNSGNPAIGGVQQTKDALMAIPTLSIVLPQAGLTSSATGIYSNAGSRGFAWEREASLELIHPPGYVDPDGNDEGFQSPCGLRIRGGFSRRDQNPKHSFRLFFRGDYGNGRLNYKLFGDEGADEFDKFDLRGPQNYSWAMGGSGQNTFIRDTWSRDLQGEMGQPYTRSRWYHLYLNGVYWGMCETEERPEANYAETYFGGDQLDYDVVKSFGDVTDGNRSSYQRLHQKWQAGFSTNAALYDIQGLDANGNPSAAHEKLIDLQNLIDYMLITYYTADRDGPGSRFTQPRPNNYFGVYNRVNPDGYKFFEHDSEHSMGTHGDAFNMVSPFTSSSTLEQFNPHTLHEKLANDNLEYRMAFADRVAEACYNDGLLTPQAGLDRIERRASVIDGAIIAHSARWGDTTRSRTNWQSAVQNVRNFISGRIPIMIGQLRAVDWYPSMDPPLYNQHGGLIASTDELLISGSPGTIYYTLNGADPRQIGGALNPGAQMFQSSTITQTLVAAGSDWKYLDNGSNQGAAWRAPGFNDAGWATGPAQLGYGDDDEATEVSFGPDSGNKYATTYYRHTFTASGVGNLTSLTLGLVRDDGAIVYLNGNEIVRSNMPAGVVAHTTNAAGVVGGGDENTFFTFDIPTASLAEGSNTLAVEIHQASGGSSDTSFDLRLIGVQTTTADPLFLTQPGVNVLRSRVRDGAEWSAITEATFLVDTDVAAPMNLAITEIHYRPIAPSEAELGAGFNERSDFEYLELENFGSRLIDLGGMAFTTGIGFAFDDSLLGRTLAPGERILLVNNLAAFEMRYGAGLPVAGEFSGSLSNDGEQLIITDAAGAIVLDVTYNDADPWPASADGDGYSLVLIDPASMPDADLPTSWRTSAGAGGNPGSSDAQNYAGWKAANGITDDGDDPEGDDLTHFMEYALGGDPFTPSPETAPRAELRAIDVDGTIDTYLTIELRRRLGADDIESKAEISSDLTMWEDGEPDLILVSAINNNDGTETLTFRTANPVPNDSRLFVRGQFELKN